MPFPTRYSSAASSTNLVAATSGYLEEVNFSGQTVDSSPCAFTAGGWVRFNPAPSGNSSYLVFAANGQFNLNLINGLLSASFAQGSGSITSSIGISDNAWHYLAVSFQGNISGPGACQLYIDGQDVTPSSNTLSSTGPTTTTFVELGSGAGIEFASWCIWGTVLATDAMDVPILGAPLIGTDEDADLVAAWDFANGPAKDESGDGHSITASSQSWHVPCLYSTDQNATVDPADKLNPGGDGPFTMMGWGYGIPNPNTWGWLVVMNAPVNTGNTGIMVQANGSDQIAFFCSQTSEGSSTFQVVLPAGGAEWVHLALTYDGTQTVAYLNGIAQTPVPQTLSPATAFPLLIGGPASPGEVVTAYTQGVSIWKKALTAQEIDRYMRGEDPTGVEGCVAYFPLLTDGGNQITGRALTLNDCSFTELDTPVTEAGTRVLNAEPGEIRLMTLADHRKLAVKHGIDVTAIPDLTAPPRPELAEAVRWYETLLTGVPKDVADQLRIKFRTNLQIAYQLYEKGIRTGGFEARTEGNDTVIYYHTEDGPQEVNRLSNVTLSPMLLWCLTILFDVGSVVAAMFGILTTAAKVTKAAGLFDDILLQSVGAAAKNNQNNAPKALFEVLKVLWNKNRLFSFLKALVTASWWNITFIVLSLVAQLVAILASGGALIAAKVASMAISIAQLIYDLLHIPLDAIAGTAAAATVATSKKAGTA